MLSSLVQIIGRGSGSATIATGIEKLIAAGDLGPGERLPAVRKLALDLQVSPATVAAGYRLLRDRGLVTAGGRNGTAVAAQPPLRVRLARQLPPGIRDLASGNPDPALLPRLGPVLARIDTTHKLYGGAAVLPRLGAIAQADYARDGIAGEIAVVAGALDGIERVLRAELRSGDKVAVEDPSWPRIGDLVHAIGMRTEPVPVDQAGPVPDVLQAALQAGARAVIITPRGQNPTGAAVDERRAAEIQRVLAAHPRVLVIEDDYLAAIAGAAYATLHGRSERWATIRSVSKVLGPDLRLATLAGDPLTISRVAGQQLLGPGWVSHLLQQAVAALSEDAATSKLLDRAAHRYDARRTALVAALAEYGITAHGRSGLGVWIPVHEEAAIVQALAERGWAVSPGERYRYRTPPGIRVTTAALKPADGRRLADDIAAASRRAATTYTG